MQLKNTFIYITLIIFSHFSVSSENNELITPYNLNEKYLDYLTPYQPIVGQSGMVVSQNSLSSDVGINILNQGGNAVDAAVAVGFSLAVTLPRAGSLGGGGFMLIYMKDENAVININYKSESSRNASNTSLFGNKEAPKDYDRNMVRYGYKAIAVPGTVAGLLKAHELYGSMPLSILLKDAIKQAKNGITVSYDLENAVRYTNQLKANKESNSIFFNKGNPLKEGSKFIQSELGDVLELIAKNGSDGFYKGFVAEKISKAMKKNSGFIDATDLANYEAKVTKPLSINYRNHIIFASNPPSVGGSVILESLSVLENFELKSYEPNSSEVLHLLAESLRRGHMDRSINIGDPVFYNDYTNELISKKRGKELSKSISIDKATKNSEISPYSNLTEGTNTTHYSIIDKDGNAVSNTFTLGYSYGSGVTIPGTGILMNNQMSNFSYDYDSPSISGRFANPLNRLEPNKRSVTNMSPVMTFEDNELRLITGSPGGARIPAAILRVITGVIDFDLSISDATMLPRINMNFTPDEYLEYESIVSKDTVDNLEKKGHLMIQSKSIGGTQSIYSINGVNYGYSDLRRPNGGVSIQIN